MTTTTTNRDARHTLHLTHGDYVVRQAIERRGWYPQTTERETWQVTFRGHYGRRLQDRHFATAAAAIAFVRETEAEKSRRAGLEAARELWDDLCGRNAAAAKHKRTAGDLLRDATTRKLLYAIVADGKQYSAELDYYARGR